jgi:hypothetical protein
LGLRLDSRHLSSNCPAQSFKLTNPASGKDGTVALVPVSTRSPAEPCFCRKRCEQC